ncbi:MAG: hypothetical protein JWP27_1693 [Flaviaesturariibacter sp.]|nr:hypothetical protein [Flaviaesturariibacter sp.]
MKHRVPRALLLAFAALCLSTATMAQDRKEKSQKKETESPEKVRNFDEVLEKLERSQVEMEAQLSKPLPPIPPIDSEKIKAEVEKALKNLDVAKLEASLSQKEMVKMKADLQKLREIELPRIEAEMKAIRPQIEKSLQGARESIEQAKVEIREYKAFEEALVKEGLIDASKYELEHRDGTLTINGKVQPTEVYNRHRAFLEKHKTFVIRKSADELCVEND